MRPIPIHLLLILPLCACRAPLPRTPQPPASLEAALDDLYRAFDFDPGQAPDWRAMRALFAPGAVFVAPGGSEAVGVERFLADFQDWTAGPIGETGLHERILSTRIEHFGTIAHAWVTFEGFEPLTGHVRTLGVDSIGLVRAGDEWKLVSFTTQYTDEALPLPDRFR